MPLNLINHVAKNNPDALEIMPWLVMGKPKRKSGDVPNVKPARVMLAIPDEWVKPIMNDPPTHIYMLVRVGVEEAKRAESPIVLLGEE